MRPMDDDNSQNNIVKTENSNQSSPIPTPSPPSTNIRVNSTLKLTTVYDAERIGKVVAYDPSLNLVTLHIKGSKPGLTSVAVINLNHCRDYTIEQEPKDDIVESLYPIDISKIKKRQAENEAEKKKEVSFINPKASRIGQALFRDIKKTMNQMIRWSNNDIIINNTVRIIEPYHSENVLIDTSSQSNNTINSKISAKGDNDTKIYIIKLVDKFWSDQLKSNSNNDLIASATTTK